MASPNDFSRANKETLKEIIREAESYLAAQLTASLAANARALSLTGFLATVTVVLAGAGLNLILATPSRVALGLICCGVAAGFTGAMWVSIRAAMPTRFWFVGNSPEMWIADIKAKKPFSKSLGEMAAFYSSMIADNRECMLLSNARLNLAMQIVLMSLVGGGFFIVVSFQAGVLH
jgi:hypothetical protein